MKIKIRIKEKAVIVQVTQTHLKEIRKINDLV